MSHPKSNELFLTVMEFSKKTSLSEKTVRRRIAEGKIPSWQPGGPGSRILIPISCLSTTSSFNESALHFEGSNDTKSDSEVIPGPKLHWKQN